MNIVKKLATFMNKQGREKNLEVKVFFKQIRIRAPPSPRIGDTDLLYAPSKFEHDIKLRFA